MKKRDNEVVAQEVEEKGFFLRGVRLNEVAAKFRKQMKEHGLLMKDVAERLKVSEAAVSRSLSGKQNLSVEQLFRLADAIETEFKISFSSSDEYTDVKISAACLESSLVEAGELFEHRRLDYVWRRSMDSHSDYDRVEYEDPRLTQLAA